jgi:hypothetical protein
MRRDAAHHSPEFASDLPFFCLSVSGRNLRLRRSWARARILSDSLMSANGANDISAARGDARNIWRAGTVQGFNPRANVVKI